MVVEITLGVCFPVGVSMTSAPLRPSSVSESRCEQRLARAASPLHAEECTKAKRKSLDAHKLIAEQFWIKYPHARLPDAAREQQPQMRLMAGDELAGLRVAVRIAEQRELVVGGGIRSRKLEVQHDLAALARWADDSRREGWHIVEIRSSQFAAWRERLRFWCGGIEPKTERIWMEPYDPAIHDLPKLHPDSACANRRWDCAFRRHGRRDAMEAQAMSRRR